MDTDVRAERRAATGAGRGAAAAIIALGVAITLLGPAALALGGSAGRAGAPTLVIAPPWVSPAAAAREAGGRPIGPTEAPLATLAVFDGPGLAARLRRAGAWFALDGAAVARWCGVDA
jgi:hypothetical protein